MQRLRQTNKKFLTVCNTCPLASIADSHLPTMTFSLDRTVEILERTPTTLQCLITGLNSDWTSANEGPDTWSVFDIIGHLIHGEKTDWIPRAELMLSDKDDKLFTPFDRFAQFENSRNRDLASLLTEFAELRQANIEKLKNFNLTDTDLQKTGIHPSFGSVTLQQLLATWAVHDLNHLSQIARVMAKQYKDAVGPWIEFLGILRVGNF